MFAQPDAIFWTGLAEEERIDGNIGLIYRAELTRDLVAGASVFYGHDFQIGHTRLSGSIDLQEREKEHEPNNLRMIPKNYINLSTEAHNLYRRQPD